MVGISVASWEKRPEAEESPFHCSTPLTLPVTVTTADCSVRLPSAAVAEPCGNAHGPHTPGPTESELAVPPFTCQVNVTCCPGAIVSGEALKLSVNGACTCTIAVWG